MGTGGVLITLVGGLVLLLGAAVAIWVKGVKRGEQKSQQKWEAMYNAKLKVMRNNLLMLHDNPNALFSVLHEDDKWYIKPE